MSFNLPAIIFSTKNSDLISEHYTLTLEQIRESASGYNVKNKDGVYSRIGFTPLSNENFLYLTTKLHKVDIRDGKNQLEWNEEHLQKNIEYMREWVRTDNTSAQVEEEFAYKINALGSENLALLAEKSVNPGNFSPYIQDSPPYKSSFLRRLLSQ